MPWVAVVVSLPHSPQLCTASITLQGTMRPMIIFYLKMKLFISAQSEQKNHRGLNIEYLNIKSIRNKFEFLKLLIADNVDAFAVAETKIGQFLLDAFSRPSDFIEIDMEVAY